MALMRLTLSEDRVVANLAQMALNLAKNIQDAESRAELAEASLEAERTRIASFIAAIQRCGAVNISGAKPDLENPTFEESRARRIVTRSLMSAAV